MSGCRIDRTAAYRWDKVQARRSTEATKTEIPTPQQHSIQAQDAAVGGSSPLQAQSSQGQPFSAPQQTSTSSHTRAPPNSPLFAPPRVYADGAPFWLPREQRTRQTPTEREPSLPELTFPDLTITEREYADEGDEAEERRNAIHSLRRMHTMEWIWGLECAYDYMEADPPWSHESLGMTESERAFGLEREEIEYVIRPEERQEDSRDQEALSMGSAEMAGYYSGELAGINRGVEYHHYEVSTGPREGGLVS
ncbi:hypothetical protein BDY21DRAFT_389849 [Lineolata rhizophorae]|uniref:Uncharacterized protein n=1 Tax=Lineolata rhizophorae TaxID=578093 RepID=A0A6A6PFW2_9PEZI|nr:hypothetical protein BDY21DRAFT_389849 [Lineolata rhizophorae]